MGLGWLAAYMSVQSVAPYVNGFEARPDILIGVTNAGSMRARIGTRENIHKVHGSAGSMIVIPDKTAFDIASQSVVHTSHLYLRRAILDEVAGGIYRGDPANIKLIPRMAIFDPVLEQLHRLVRDALDADAVSSCTYVDHVTRTLAAYLLRKHSDADKQHKQASLGGGLSARQVDRTREIIEARLGERLAIADLAADTGMTADHFGRLFKKATGMSLYKYVIQCRVDRARRLLAETVMPIVVIAHESGFADQVHLTRAFSRLVGTTPAAFRKEWRS